MIEEEKYELNSEVRKSAHRILIYSYRRHSFIYKITVYKASLIISSYINPCARRCAVASYGTYSGVLNYTCDTRIHNTYLISLFLRTLFRPVVIKRCCKYVKGTVFLSSELRMGEEGYGVNS
jgi:hypothetical protein